MVYYALEEANNMGKIIKSRVQISLLQEKNTRVNRWTTKNCVQTVVQTKYQATERRTISSETDDQNDMAKAEWMMVEAGYQGS